jgi:signal transduction histidine kinase/DNA-binding response OmpR family regulator
MARHADRLDEDPSDPNLFWASSVSTVYRIRVFDDRDPVVEDEWPVIARSAPLFDPDGGLWIGGAEGLHRIENDRHRVFDRADGLPVSEVRALHRDSSGGLWLGTYGGGLVHFDGREFRSLDQRHGLADNAISSIVADDFGALWMSCNRGIQRVLVSDLEAFLNGTIDMVPSLLLGTQHGLDNPEAVGAHSGVRVGDRMYFSTFGGLAVVNPAVTASREQSTPQIHLLERSGDRRLSGKVRLELDRSERNFELRFSGIHLSAPETLRYRYRLIGKDPDWITGTMDHRMSYTGLAPGEYRLRLQARHSGGPWVDASVQPTIVVSPMWWETTAAGLAGVFAVLAALIGLWMLANRQVRQRAQALETLVAERTSLLRSERDTVARQARRLEELADGRARFIAGISHELRTPLTLIRGPLDALVEREAATSKPGLAEMMQRARANVDRLQSLIDRLLESARLEAGALALKVREVDLSDWLDEFAERIRPLFDDRQSRLVMELPEAALPAWIDPVLMESAITNLLVNALRHGSGPVKATLRASRDANGDPLLEVVDDGPGIAPEHRAHVFERFYRAHGEHSAGSYGLGLWLVREVIERHHGTVELLDSEHRGAHFRLRIPAGREHFRDTEIGMTARETVKFEFEVPAVRAENDASSAAPRDIPTALVVDDHAGIRALVRDALGEKWQFVEAIDGRDALDVVRLRLPDVIISDLMMPRMDGIELLHALRADPDTDFLPIVLLTAKTGNEDRIAGLEQGADAYLAKPFSGRELRAVIEGLLARQKRLRARFQADSADPVDLDRPSWAPDDLTEAQRILINRFQAAVEARLADEDLAVEALAAALGQSRATLYRKLKQATDRSPSELIREIRLLQAHQLLEQGAGSVSEIGYAVGFRSVAHFSNAFFNRYGQRPSQVRTSGSGP